MFEIWKVNKITGIEAKTIKEASHLASFILFKLPIFSSHVNQFQGLQIPSKLTLHSSYVDETFLAVGQWLVEQNGL